MKDNNLPNRDMLYIPTLKALEKLGGSSKISQLEEVVIDIAGITDEQLAVTFPEGSRIPGGSKVLNSIAWARSSLKASGAAANSERGVWSITEEGKKYLAMPESEAIQLIKQMASAHWSSQQKLKKEQDVEYIDADEEDSFEEESWKIDLLKTLNNMDPTVFEHLAARLLLEAGFQNVEVTPQTKDGGIDGYGTYKISLVSFPIYFQCKRHKSNVSSKDIRDFRGAMSGRGDRGLFITTADFTLDAKIESKRDGTPPIDLIDGEELCDLLLEYSLGVEKRTVIRVEINRDFFKNL